MGVAPHAWLHRQRIDRAKALLRERDQILGSVARIISDADGVEAAPLAMRLIMGFAATAWPRSVGAWGWPPKAIRKTCVRRPFCGARPFFRRCRNSAVESSARECQDHLFVESLAGS